LSQSRRGSLEAIGLTEPEGDLSDPRDLRAKALGERIKMRMEQLGINQSELARRAQTNRHNVSTWVNGKFVPRRKALKKVAEALECEVTDLYPSLQKLKKPAPKNVRRFEFTLKEGGTEAFVHLQDILPFEAALEIANVIARVNAKTND
jgi:transcriptional regulator with XRE-family HTH domain